MSMAWELTEVPVRVAAVAGTQQQLGSRERSAVPQEAFERKVEQPAELPTENPACTTYRLGGRGLSGAASGASGLGELDVPLSEGPYSFFKGVTASLSAY